MGGSLSAFGERWRHVGHVKDEWEKTQSAGEASQVVSRLTEAQLAEYRDAFNSFDKDSGGSIDKAELKELMSSVGQNPTDDELAEMIRIADADGTGDIDFAEFVTLMAHKNADEKTEATLRAAFNVFDVSGDGFISAEEMRRIMINVGEPVSLEDIVTAMKKIDDNGDGVIDFEEFTKVINDEKENQFGQGDDTEKKKPGYLTPPPSMRNMVRRASSAVGFGTEK